MRNQLIMPILLSAAHQLGLNVLVEPTRGIYGVILFDNGKKYYVKDINFNLNLTASSSLAKNKAATSFFLKRFGYHVPEFTMIYDDEKCERIKSKDTIQEGLKYANRIGFPVILKPNNMSQGSFVFKVMNERDFHTFASEVLRNTDSAQVQKFYSGNDYRIVVLDQKILSAYQRVPLHIIGDGESSISDLIDMKQQAYVLSGRDTKLTKMDMRLAYKLSQRGLTLQSIPSSGEKIYLQDISNLCIGGDTVELTDQIHNSFKKWALMLARDMNLTLCGIDLITEDITKEFTDEYIVIEVNSAPGLDNYAYEGIKQEIYVENLYREILLYIKNMYT